MGKSKKMAKSSRRSPVTGRLVLEPRGFIHSKRAVQTLSALPKSHNHAQGIVHDGVTRVHTTVFDTVYQNYRIGMVG